MMFVRDVLLKVRLARFFSSRTSPSTKRLNPANELLRGVKYGQAA